MAESPVVDEDRAVRNLLLTVCDLKQQGDIPTGRVGAQVVTVGTRMYLHGGADEKRAYDDLHVMEIEKAAWRKLSVSGFSKPTARYGHSLLSWGDTLVLFGGLAAEEEDDDVVDDERKSFPPPPFMCDPPLPGMPSPPVRSWDHSGRPSDALFLLKAEGLVWSVPETEGSSPTPRGFHGAVIVDNRLVVFGGATDASLEEGNDELFVLDLEEMTWTTPQQKGHRPSPRYGHKMCRIAQRNLILMFGGADDKGVMFSLSLDSPESVTWSKMVIAGNPPLSRSFHTLDAIGDRVLVFAGQTISDVSDLYIFDAHKMRWSRPLYEGKLTTRAHASSVLHDKLVVFGGTRLARAADKPDALGNETRGIGSWGCVGEYRLSKKLFFLNVLEIKEGPGEGRCVFKLVMVGDSGVGKSSLVTRFATDDYSDFHMATVGVDFRSIVAMIRGRLVTLKLWDTAGQERFCGVTGNYYRNANGFVLVYDATRRQTFEQIDAWLERIQEHHDLDASTLKLLIGNKHDLRDKMQVSEKEGQALADRIGALFVPTSAKTAANVDAAFLSAASKLVDMRTKSQMNAKSMVMNSTPLTREGIRLDNSQTSGAQTVCSACGGGGSPVIRLTMGSASSSSVSSADERQSLTGGSR